MRLPTRAFFDLSIIIWYSLSITTRWTLGLLCLILSGFTFSLLSGPARYSLGLLATLWACSLLSGPRSSV